MAKKKNICDSWKNEYQKAKESYTKAQESYHKANAEYQALQHGLDPEATGNFIYDISAENLKLNEAVQEALIGEGRLARTGMLGLIGKLNRIFIANDIYEEWNDGEYNTISKGAALLVFNKMVELLGKRIAVNTARITNAVTLAVAVVDAGYTAVELSEIKLKILSGPDGRRIQAKEDMSNRAKDQWYYKGRWNNFNCNEFGDIDE
jgi:hypothetical protein